MKIYGKQVYVGTKKICTEYTSKLIGGTEDLHIGTNDYKGTPIEENLIFIQDKHGYFVDINSIDGNGFLALNIYGAVQRYTQSPHRAGDVYVDNLKKYLPIYDHETLYDVKELVERLKNNKGITID